MATSTTRGRTGTIKSLVKEVNLAYKYYTSGSPPYLASASSILVNEFQANVAALFEVASDVFSIQEETTFGTNQFSTVRARVKQAISNMTGKSLGDDFKELVFADINHSIILGQKYQFDNCYWIAFNVESIKSLVANVVVRRANNSLKWIDSDGIRHSEPCSIDYSINRTRDQIGTENPVTAEGYIKIYCQLNSQTEKIKANQRFIFGRSNNKICYRIFGDGIRSFLNRETMDDTTSTLLEIQAGVYQINPDVDDLVDGYADAYADRNNLTSGSNVGALNILVNPNVNYLLQGTSASFAVNYYSGSSIVSGSFVFSVHGSDVPTSKYAFGTLGKNSFEIFNISRYTNHTLDILCSGSSGSRILNMELRGDW
jgi:hypothetical protein